MTPSLNQTIPVPSQLGTIRDRILLQILPDVAFDGWTMATLARGAAAAGFAPEMARAVFPQGVADLLDHFADHTDRQMLAAVPAGALAAMRVRDRVQALVLARFARLDEVAEAERLALRYYWAMPRRGARAARIGWRTADRIWRAAGDTATDYNHYTKRALLAGVLASAILAWLKDAETVPSFVARRIENVMQLGGVLGKIRPDSLIRQVAGAARRKVR